MHQTLSADLKYGKEESLNVETQNSWNKIISKQGTGISVLKKVLKNCLLKVCLLLNQMI